MKASKNKYFSKTRINIFFKDAGKTYIVCEYNVPRRTASIKMNKRKYYSDTSIKNCGYMKSENYF